MMTNDVIIVESFVACMGDNDGKCFAVRGIYRRFASVSVRVVGRLPNDY
jgi:hypothetical protein